MIDELINELVSSVDTFTKDIPAIEKLIFRRLILLTKELSLTSVGSIENNLENIKLIGGIKKELENIILSKSYLSSVGEYLGAFATVSEIQSEYFSTLSSAFTPSKVLVEVQKQAIADATEMLKGSGLNVNLITPVKNIMKTSIKSGSNYADMQQELSDAILGNEKIPGKLLSYTKQIATDAINQYSATYTKLVTDDLGLEWFQYVGSLKRLSRPLCVALVRKRWIHVSEIPDIVQGIIDGKEVSTAGMIDPTTAATFQILRGGYNCGHQLIPVDALAVPDRVKKEIK